MNEYYFNICENFIKLKYSKPLKINKIIKNETKVNQMKEVFIKILGGV